MTFRTRPISAPLFLCLSVACLVLATPFASSQAQNVAERAAAPAETSSSRNLSASEIWNAFFFGDPNRTTSTPKFVFSPEVRAVDRENRARRAATTFDETLRDESNVVESNVVESNVVETRRDATPGSEARRDDARRRRIQELNAILAARRPNEFAPSLDAAELNAPLANAETPQPARANFVVDGVREFDAARANRSKIRQVSNIEQEASEQETADAFVDDGLGFVAIPTRPNAVRLSARVFLSSEIVRLPNAASVESPEIAPNSENIEKSDVAPTLERLDVRPPSLDSRPESPNSTPVAQSSFVAPQDATVKTPNQPSATTRRGFPVLRPSAPFVDPQTVPNRR